MSKKAYEIRFCFKQGGKVSAFPKEERSFKIGKALKRELEKTCEIIKGLEPQKNQTALSLKINSREAKYYHCLINAIRDYVNDPEGFGKCQKCAKDIPLERLQTVPVCKHCVSCKVSCKHN